MPPLPKRKHSKGRRDRRRAHDALQPPALIVCPNCGELGITIPAELSFGLEHVELAPATG